MYSRALATHRSKSRRTLKNYNRKKQSAIDPENMPPSNVEIKQDSNVDHSAPVRQVDLTPTMLLKCPGIRLL